MSFLFRSYFYFIFSSCIYLIQSVDSQRTRCRFTASPRWARLSLPVTGSAVCIMGRAHSTVGVRGTGILIISVDEITYNPGISHSLAENVDKDSVASPSPSRKLKVKKKTRAGLAASALSESDAHSKCILLHYVYIYVTHRYKCIIHVYIRCFCFGGWESIFKSCSSSL